MVAPKGPSYVSAPWGAPEWARPRDVYTGLVPKGLLSFGGILGGGESQPIPGKPAVKAARGSSPRVWTLFLPGGPGTTALNARTATAPQVYAHSCRIANSKPNSIVYKTFLDIAGRNYLLLRELSFADNYFGDKGLQNLFHVLNHLPSLRSLNLRNNFITTKSLAPLTNVLVRHPMLCKLDLSDNTMIYTKQVRGLAGRA